MSYFSALMVRPRHGLQLLKARAPLTVEAAGWTWLLSVPGWIAAAENLVAWNSTLAYQIPITFASGDVGSPAPIPAWFVSAHQTTHPMWPARIAQGRRKRVKIPLRLPSLRPSTNLRRRWRWQGSVKQGVRRSAARASQQSLLASRRRIHIRPGTVGCFLIDPTRWPGGHSDWTGLVKRGFLSQARGMAFGKRPKAGHVQL